MATTVWHFQTTR